jgi:hypothetical protein
MPTTTPLNAWPVPVSTDLVKDGAEAIEDLGDAIDASVGSGLLAWQTWAPTLSLGWLNGNGTWDAKYCQIGKIVHFRGTFTIGTTTTKGTNLAISLPVTRASIAYVNFEMLGIGTNSIFGAYSGTTTTITTFVSNASATYLTRNTITATTPFTWATGDGFVISGTYEAA